MRENNTKLNNFINALERLKEGVNKYNLNDTLLRDGIIQRFEFTFELAWKTLKKIFEDEGILGLNSPKSVLKEAFSAKIIDDEKIWLSMLMDRNMTTHIYDEMTSINICKNIVERYLKEFENLREKIIKRLEN